jgi:hypothetical protein
MLQVGETDEVKEEELQTMHKEYCCISVYLLSLSLLKQKQGHSM